MKEETIIQKNMHKRNKWGQMVYTKFLSETSNKKRIFILSFDNTEEENEQGWMK